jgi:hypothetical protein
MNRVEALTSTAAASTSSVNRLAAARSEVTMASEWPDPKRSMWSMAPSRSSTTATDKVAPRNSVAKSSSEASAMSGRTERVAASPSRVTPSRAAATRGRKAGATARWTSRLSALLQTPGRWVLALTTMDSAMDRSAEAST